MKPTVYIALLRGEREDSACVNVVIVIKHLYSATQGFAVHI